MLRRFVLLIVALLLCAGCPDNTKDATGPGVSIHCAAQTPQLGNGDTTVRVTCPPSTEAPQTAGRPVDP